MNDFDSVPLEFFQDYPEPGVNFIDVGCIFDTPEYWRLAIDTLYARTEAMHFDFILSMDARGFMIAGALAYERRVGFAMARKAGKLPGNAISIDSSANTAARPSRSSPNASRASAC
jgi:adenine phosphoribosyltransferase